MIHCRRLVRLRHTHVGQRPATRSAPPGPRGTVRARGFLLNELMAALPLIAVATTLATAMTAVVLRGYTRSPQMANEYTAIEGLLAHLREDTRAAGTAEWTPASGGTRCLVLHTTSGDIRYRFQGQGVHRAGPATGADRGLRYWDLPHGSIRVTSEPGRTGEHVSLLTVHIRWRGRSSKDVDPARRFDARYAIGRGYQR